MFNGTGSSATPTRRRFFFRRPSSNASTTSVASIATTLPNYADVLPEAQTGSGEAPRSSNIPEPDAASMTSVTPNATVLPAYSAVLPEERTESDETPRSSNVPLSDPEPVAPPQQHRPFRPLPRIPISRTSSISQSTRPPSYISRNLTDGGDGSRMELFFPLLVGGGAEHHIENSFPLGGPNSWATLYTFTPESVAGLVHDFQSAKRNVPTFIEGGNITGMLELELDAPQTIQQIILTVCFEVSAHDSSHSKDPIYRSKVRYSLDLWLWRSKGSYSSSTIYGTSQWETRDTQLKRVTEGCRGHISSPSLSRSHLTLTTMHFPMSRPLCLHSLWHQSLLQTLPAQIPRPRHHQLLCGKRSYDLRCWIRPQSSVVLHHKPAISPRSAVLFFHNRKYPIQWDHRVYFTQHLEVLPSEMLACECNTSSLSVSFMAASGRIASAYASGSSSSGLPS